MGFLSYILERGIEGSYADHGVRVCDGQGNDATLNLLEALTDGGLMFGGFADDEGKALGRWSALKGDSAQHVGQPSLRVDAVQLCRLDQGISYRGRLPVGKIPASR